MRDSQLYIPSSLRHKLSLIARKRKVQAHLVYNNQRKEVLAYNSDEATADSVAVELLEWAIAQKHPEFAAAYAEREDWDKRLMETIK